MPHKYSRHVEKQMKQVFELYFSVLFIAIILSFLIFIPVLKLQTQGITHLIDNFDRLNITIDVETNNPVTLVASPEVVVDTNATSRDGSRLLISDDKIYYKKLFRDESKDRISSIDLLSHKDKLAEWFFLIVLIVLPGYVLGMGLLSLIVTLVLVLVFSLIAKTLFKKREFTFRDCFIAAVHASIPGLFLFLILLPFHNYWWVVILLFFLIYTLALLLMKGYKFESVGSKEED